MILGVELFLSSLIMLDWTKQRGITIDYVSSFPTTRVTTRDAGFSLFFVSCLRPYKDGTKKRTKTATANAAVMNLAQLVVQIMSSCAYCWFGCLVCLVCENENEMCDKREGGELNGRWETE